jgi:hypothetical protein
MLTRAIGLTMLVVAAYCPWVATRSSGGGRIRLVDLTVSKWVFLVLVLALVVASALEITQYMERGCRAAVAVIALLMLMVPSMALVIIEVLAVWLYPDLLPSTLRRLTFGVEPLFGIWLAMAGAALVLLSATEVVPEVVSRLVDLSQGLRARNPSSFAALLLVIGLPLLGAGRSAVWLNVDSTAGNWSMPGFAIPWIGVGTLVLLAIALLGSVAWFTRPTMAAGIALLITGWAMTIPPALLMAISVAIPRLTAPGWIRSHLSHWSVQLHAIPGVGTVTPRVPSTLTGALTTGKGPALEYAAGTLIALAGLCACRAMNGGNFE